MSERIRFLAAVVIAAFCIGPLAADAADSSAGILQVLSVDGASSTDVRQFYELRGFQPAWNATDRAAALAVLEHAGHEGLNAADYRLSPAFGPREDIALTQMVLRYARDVRTGRLAPRSVFPDVDFASQNFVAAPALNKALNDGALSEFFSGLPPQTAAYRFLRKTLAHYRERASSGGWQALSLPRGPVSGWTQAARRALQRRLAAEDEAIPASDLSITDLDAALRRFQERQGLTVDGKMGPQTQAALNISAAERVRQIEANMERWRWLPHRLENRYVEVNTAAATLTVYEGKNAVLRSRIVVGKPSSPTPIFASEIQGVTINPPWTVPNSIVRNEILPKLRRNPNYLANQNMILRNGPPGDPHGQTINWKKVSRTNFPYVVQQQPGTNNALGLIKLEMPNRFDVYLHDTPSKALFERDDRFFSHGCMRVQQVGALARYALTGDPAADVAHLFAPDGKTERIPLKSPLKVYVVYWTVFEAPDGSAAFRKDIYGRDAKLIDALDGRRVAAAAKMEPACGDG
jgi:murein L,D-transpeptidase YcbB/YkuD